MLSFQCQSDPHTHFVLLSLDLSFTAPSTLFCPLRVTSHTHLEDQGGFVGPKGKAGSTCKRPGAILLLFLPDPGIRVIRHKSQGDVWVSVAASFRKEAFRSIHINYETKWVTFVYVWWWLRDAIEQRNKSTSNVRSCD